MKNLKAGLIVGVALASALGLSACATKDYVDKQVGGVTSLAQDTQSKLSGTQSQVDAEQAAEKANEAKLADAAAKLAAHDAQLASLDGTTRQALERAEAAGKLAEGKFLYSMVLSDDSIKFPVNKTELSPQAQARLGELVEKLKADNRNVYLEIQGHTDASGPPAINEKVGEERAEAVRRFLSRQGIALNRMSTISYGEDDPVAPNKTKQGRAQNRRVVVVVLS